MNLALQAAFATRLIKPGVVVLLSTWLSLWSTSATAQAVRSLKVEQPRPFGYAVGDTLEQRIELELNQPYRLDRASLPAAGRVGRWLRLAVPELASEPLDDAIRYRLTLRYQLINIEPQVGLIDLPALKLRFSDGQGRFATPVNGWSFRPVTLTDPAGRDLRPERLPPPVWQPAAGWLWLAAGVAGGAALALAVRRRWLPGSGRRDPFFNAARALRRLGREPDSPERYRRALALVHEAFNRSAGRTVFGHDLAGFFAARRRLLPLRQPVERYFEHSRRALFAPLAPEQRYSLDALSGLCLALSERERR